MNRINKVAGTTITIYHTFHDEVRYYKTHVWKCDGPCQHRPPYYGIVKRSMNRYHHASNHHPPQVFLVFLALNSHMKLTRGFTFYSGFFFLLLLPGRHNQQIDGMRSTRSHAEEHIQRSRNQNRLLKRNRQRRQQRRRTQPLQRQLNQSPNQNHGRCSTTFWYRNRNQGQRRRRRCHPCQILDPHRVRRHQYLLLLRRHRSQHWRIN